MDNGTLRTENSWIHFIPCLFEHLLTTVMIHLPWLVLMLAAFLPSLPLTAKASGEGSVFWYLFVQKRSLFFCLLLIGAYYQYLSGTIRQWAAYATYQQFRGLVFRLLFSGIPLALFVWITTTAGYLLLTAMRYSSLILSYGPLTFLRISQLFTENLLMGLIGTLLSWSICIVNIIGKIAGKIAMILSVAAVAVLSMAGQTEFAVRYGLLVLPAIFCLAALFVSLSRLEKEKTGVDPFASSQSGTLFGPLSLESSFSGTFSETVPSILQLFQKGLPGIVRCYPLYLILTSAFEMSLGNTLLKTFMICLSGIIVILEAVFYADLELSEHALNLKNRMLSQQQARKAVATYILLTILSILIILYCPLFLYKAASAMRDGSYTAFPLSRGYADYFKIFTCCSSLIGFINLLQAMAISVQKNKIILVSAICQIAVMVILVIMMNEFNANIFLMFYCLVGIFSLAFGSRGITLAREALFRENSTQAQ